MTGSAPCSEPKDAFDLVYVIRGTEGGQSCREAEGARSNPPEVVDHAVAFLARNFESPGHIGPLRAADFDSIDGDDLDAAAAAAHGHVDDLLKAYRGDRPPGL